MLYISFKRTEDTVHAKSYFDLNYLEEWFGDPLVQKMIQDIDRSEVLGPYCIQSPVLGQIPPTKLSGGVKALILLLKQPELEIYATSCGDNCAKWIVEISKLHDIHIVLRHIMHFDKDFEAICVDTGAVIKTLDDYSNCVIDCFD